MHPRIPRLVMAAPMIAALAVTLAASGGAPTARTDTPALKSISSRLDGAVSTVLIESSEPVAYLTSQPDPLTVLVDLRNVNADAMDARAERDAAGAGDGCRDRACQRARRLAGGPRARQPRSRRQAPRPQLAQHDPRRSGEVRFHGFDRFRRCTRSTGATLKLVAAPKAVTTPLTARSDADDLAARRLAPPATELRSRQGRRRCRTGMPSPCPATVRSSRPRLTRRRTCRRASCWTSATCAPARSPAVTNVNTADIQRVRVAYNSREPLITRVVIDLARKIPYTIETVGEDLRVFFNRW